MSRIRRVVNFSNVVACLALFVALGGSVYAAGKIDGKQVKPKSLPGNRIKPKTITANRIKPKTLTGKQVKAQSLTGAQIQQSTLTDVAAARLANVQYAVATVQLSGFTTTTAACPLGANVIGGGATVSNNQLASVNDSGPNPQRTGWTATGYGYFGLVPKPSMIVTAICVVVGSPVGSGPSISTPNPPVYGTG